MSNRLFLDTLDGIISYRNYMSGGSNSNRRERMKKILSAALKKELTDRERELFSAYYISGLTMPEIAAQKGVNKSTVSRAIARAKRKLRRVASYYSF